MPCMRICTLSWPSRGICLNCTYVSRYFLSRQTDGLWRGMQVCDNIGDHLIGNVYARYEWETEAQAAVDHLNDRWYAGTSFFSFVFPYTV